MSPLSSGHYFFSPARIRGWRTDELQVDLVIQLANPIHHQPSATGKQKHAPQFYFCCKKNRSKNRNLGTSVTLGIKGFPGTWHCIFTSLKFMSTSVSWPALLTELIPFLVFTLRLFCPETLNPRIFLCWIQESSSFQFNSQPQLNS